MSTAAAPLSTRARTFRIRFALGLLFAGSVLALPLLLRQGVGPDADLSSRLLLGGGMGVGTFALLFVAGVITSLTPCVYPLIPITVSIFGARKEGSRGRSMALSATYVAGIATMYSALGVFAALTGRAFGSALSSPWVIAVLASFLLVLAGSMFGFYELDVPGSLKTRLTSVRGAGFAGAFGMGLVAGIVAAPCTGPVLAGVLAWVATRRDAVLGFWMLFTYAVGVGLLFFIIGASSLRLPKGGAIFDAVKTVLGLALLGTALALVLPLLPRPQALSLSAHAAVIAAALLALAGIALGALDLSFHGSAGERARKSLGLALLLLGVGLRLGWLGTPKPSAEAGAAPAIAWLRDEAQAVSAARAQNKPLLIDFGAEWCAACKELDEHTFSDPAVRREVAERFIPLRVDATESTDEIDRIEAKYGVQGLPTVLLVACRTGEPARSPGPDCPSPSAGPSRITGFVPAPEFIGRLRAVQ